MRRALRPKAQRGLSEHFSTQEDKNIKRLSAEQKKEKSEALLAKRAARKAAQKQMAADGTWPLSGSASLPSLSTRPGQARVQRTSSIDAEQNHEAQLTLLDAKKRLVRAQRLARKQSVQLSLEGNRNSKLQAARAGRLAFEKLSGKDTRTRLAHISAATMPTMQQLSEQVSPNPNPNPNPNPYPYPYPYSYP